MNCKFNSATKAYRGSDYEDVYRPSVAEDIY